MSEPEAPCSIWNLAAEARVSCSACATADARRPRRRVCLARQRAWISSTAASSSCSAHSSASDSRARVPRHAACSVVAASRVRWRASFLASTLRWMRSAAVMYVESEPAAPSASSGPWTSSRTNDGSTCCCCCAALPPTLLSSKRRSCALSCPRSHSASAAASAAAAAKPWSAEWSPERR